MSDKIDIESQVKTPPISYVNTNPNNNKLDKVSITVSSNDSNNNTLLECCGICCISTFALALLGCAISYIVFGIIFLVNDYNVAKSCNSSGLWAYVLTAIILSVMRSNAKTSSDDNNKSNTICVLFCLGLIETGLAIWGGLELWNNSCEDLKESNLWTFGLVTFCLQVICGALFLVIIPLSFLICCIFDKKNVINNL
tara:strand:+ start:4472 stop:5062 length:591 start_codon:yes stop_codon:yes gene_type:complete